MTPSERYLTTLESMTNSPRILRAIEEIRADERGEWGPDGTEAIAAEYARRILGG